MHSEPPVFDKNTSLSFLNSAECFYNCALLFKATDDHRELLKYIPDYKGVCRPAVYANACRAIELSLKGYLRAAGKTIEDIRKKHGGRYGHDLARLHEACITEGLPSLTSDKNLEQFNVLSEHYSGKDFDYPDVQLNQGAPSIGIALDFAKRAIEAVRTFCRKNDDKHFNTKTASGGFKRKSK
ncbi:hypothetical protein WJU23_09990 [Prosthecobacter sp. SYSU 5D2]|uniref:hypothetical protein n=1 Tax=Prosthecobacter sp. SYSU 5D2 TaxID=3134134 RepID=UPI0031FE4B46